jgi:hypothetical protein
MHEAEAVQAADTEHGCDFSAFRTDTAGPA